MEGLEEQAGGGGGVQGGRGAGLRGRVLGTFVRAFNDVCGRDFEGVVMIMRGRSYVNEGAGLC